MEQVQRSQFELAIGQLSIAWAVAEHGLDQCIAVLFYAKGGDQFTREIPLNATAKIKFFRRAMNGLDWPDEEDKQEAVHADWIADLALKTLNDRNWCIHGAAFGATPNSFEPDIVFTRLKRPTLSEFERKTVTLPDIEATRDSCMKLMLAFGFFLYKPLNFLSKDQVQKALDSVGVEFPL